MNEITMMLVRTFLEHLFESDMVKEFKPYFGGVSLILMGAQKVLDLLAAGVYNEDEAGQAIAAIMLGYKTLTEVQPATPVAAPKS